ncbi:MAG TPA: radical SAM protein [Bacteroidales bacterium]|nr:radical SAM protein [Bacteroidales bacterium]
MDKYNIQSYYHRFRRLTPWGRKLKHHCFALRSNVYFHINGDVSMCSHNHSLVLGKFPENRISEIVEGEFRRQATESFLSGDIPTDCRSCYEKLKSNNPKAATFQVYNQAYRKSGIPLTAEFELSNHCNLACIMCSPVLSDQIHSEKKPDLPSPYNTDFVEQLTPYLAYLKRASFKGGEPFLIDLYFEIWEKIIASGAKTIISVTSNGTVLNKKVRDILERGRFDINISIDSLEKDKYEEIRRNASFDVFRRNLDFFIGYCKSKKTNFNSCTCLMTNNYSGVPDIYRFAIKNRFNIFMNYVEHPAYLSVKTMEKNKILEVMTYMQKHMPKFSPIRDRENRASYDAMIRQLELWAHEKEPDVTIPSQAIPEITNTEQVALLLNKLRQHFATYYGISGDVETNSDYLMQLNKFTTAYQKASAQVLSKNIIASLIACSEERFVALFSLSEEELIEFLCHDV